VPSAAETAAWLGIALVSGLWVTAIIIQEHFQLAMGWFTVAAYIVLLFATITFSFRPAWGTKVFWLGVGILFGLHALAGLVLVPDPHVAVYSALISDGDRRL
jgi:hypothetical protein